jgi:hypothetical protein
MDPVQKWYMFNHWLADQKDRMELAKNHAYLVGSFFNPEAVKSLLDQGTHESTDEEFEESTRMVMEAGKDAHEVEKSKGNRRRRHKLKE